MLDNRLPCCDDETEHVHVNAACCVSPEAAVRQEEYINTLQLEVARLTKERDALVELVRAFDENPELRGNSLIGPTLPDWIPSEIARQKKARAALAAKDAALREILDVLAAPLPLLVHRDYTRIRAIARAALEPTNAD